MAKKRPTPEEQLLNLIEKGGDAKTAKFKRKRKFFLGFGNLSRFGVSFKRAIGKSIANLKAGTREPNLKILNKVFLIICVVVGGYSITDFISKRPDIDKVYKKAEAVKYKEFEEKPAIEPGPFLYYLEMVQRRNIFSPITLKEAKEVEVKEELLSEMAKDLKLVGISWGKEPQVMIEDEKAKKTYFLKAGDTINKLKIDTVLRDRVILSYEGKKIELM